MKGFPTLLALSLVGLAGCASMDEQSTASSAADTPSPSLLEQDEAYMAYVERTARRRGIEVVWVHAPTRRPASSQGDGIQPDEE